MPVSSTFTTSAPKSASSSEQKPARQKPRQVEHADALERQAHRSLHAHAAPGRQAGDRTLMRFHLLARSDRRASRGPPRRSPDGGPCPRSSAWPSRSARRWSAPSRRSGRYRLSSRPTRIEPPSVSAAATSIHWSREIPITPQWEPAGMLSTIAARLRAVGGMPPVTPITQSTCSGVFSTPHVDQRSEAADVADVEALVLGFDAQLVHRLEQLDDLLERVREDHLEHEVLARARVLGVVHRAHVQRRHLRAAGAQVGHALLHRHADRARSSS